MEKCTTYAFQEIEEVLASFGFDVLCVEAGMGGHDGNGCGLGWRWLVGGGWLGLGLGYWCQSKLRSGVF